jgi:hypothetical protein
MSICMGIKQMGRDTGTGEGVVRRSGIRGRS